MRHQDYAGNCLEADLAQCYEIGLGPDGFDCSGFVIRTLADVGLYTLDDFEPGVRHVRDMWASAGQGINGFQFGIGEVGNLLVTKRTYVVNGRKVTIPGHIGIITRSGTSPRILHASPYAGRVEERHITTNGSVLGFLAVRGL